MEVSQQMINVSYPYSEVGKDFAWSHHQQDESRPLMINSSVEGNRLRERGDGSIEIIPKTLAEVFGEHVLRPLLDFSWDWSNRTFQVLKRSLSFLDNALMFLPGAKAEMDCMDVYDLGSIEHKRAYKQNRAYLDRSPAYFWNPDREVFSCAGGKTSIKQKGTFQAKGSAGVIPYTTYKGHTYVLLTKESWGINKNTYGDLGGAVEVDVTSDKPGAPVVVDTFLATLLREVREESSYLYPFTEEDILNQAKVFSYVYQTDDVYNGFESVFAFYKVRKVYFTEQVLRESVPYSQDLENRGLCPWAFQEKDDYQWVALRDLYAFFKQSMTNSPVYKNIFGEQIKIQLRDYVAEAFRSKEGMWTLSTLLLEEECGLSLYVDERSLYRSAPSSGPISQPNAIEPMNQGPKVVADLAKVNRGL